MLPIGTSVQTKSFPWAVAGISAVSIGIHFMLVAFQLHGGDVSRVYDALGSRPNLPIPIFWITAILLHGSFTHLSSNVLFLWIFGPPLEDRMGSARFLLLFLASGSAAEILAIADRAVFFPEQMGIPSIGASGAISGLLGMFLLRFWSARVHLMFFHFRVALPAPLVLLLWFGGQTARWLFGSGSGTFGGVSFVAHVGGFAGGVLLAQRLSLGRAGDTETLFERLALARGGPKGSSERAALALASFAPADPSASLALARSIVAGLAPGGEGEVLAATRDAASPLARASIAFRRAIEGFLQAGSRDEALFSLAERWLWLRDLDLPASLLVRLARACEASGRPAAAASLFGMALRRSDGAALFPSTLLRLGQLELSLGNASEAARALRHLRRLRGGDETSTGEAAAFRHQVAEALKRLQAERRIRRSAGRAARGAFSELAAVAGVLVATADEGRRRRLRILPLLIEAGEAVGGSAVADRLRDQCSIAASRVGTAFPSIEIESVPFDSLPPGEQHDLLRSDRALLFVANDPGRLAIAARRLALARREADAEMAELRQIAAKAAREENVAETRSARVTSWTGDDQQMFFLFALPWFLFAEGVIAFGITELAAGRHRALVWDLLMALAVPVNVGLYFVYRKIVTAPLAVLDAVARGRQESSLDGLSDARSAEKRGDHRSAEAAYRDVAEHDRTRYDAKLALAELHRYQRQDFVAAVDAYRSVARTPQVPDGTAAMALLEAATLLRERGELEQAEEALTELLRRFPKERSAVGALRLLQLVRKAK